ncbi:reverse transcriptase/maturase family protein [archaeon]|nr:reverse transcriptase/maturase family protein [archaeon]
MKSSSNLYPKLCSYNNLLKAFKKASKGKSFMPYVVEFRENLNLNLLSLKTELETLTYKPTKLKKFVIRDPKTRVIRKSIFKDRVVHHAIVNILEPIYEKTFIEDSYANRKTKGTLAAIKRFDKFKRKVSKNNKIKCFVFKADIKKFFDSVDQDTLLKIFRRNIKDKKLLWLIKQILKNFHNKEKGMPLGNMTSQFFANVYLNELDYFVKHKIKAKYYLRYVDDFVILHGNKSVLEKYKVKIKKYLKNLDLELHPNKSKIFPNYKGINFLGYKMFYYHRLIIRRNLNQFKRKLITLEKDYNEGSINFEKVLNSIDGWMAYAIWANSYKLRKKLMKEIYSKFSISSKKQIRN